MEKKNHHELLIPNSKEVDSILIFVMCMFFYPCLGLLADIKCGRYRVIRAGLWVTWVATILFCMALALLNYYFNDASSAQDLKHVTFALKICLYVPIGLGVGAVISNVIQFGVDQMEDSSSSEITSFFHWSLWLWFLTGFASGASHCICPQYEALGQLFFPAILTVSIVVDCVFSQWLVKEQPLNNPLTLIFKVLCFATKNKYPQNRNAHEYWDDRQNSRIDLAKAEYGGPFTAEQVQSVKAFFRIFSVLLTGTFLTGIFLSMFPTSLPESFGVAAAAAAAGVVVVVVVVVVAVVEGK